MVGANIRKAARHHGYSLNKLADFASVNRPHLLRVVRGDADATVGWLSRVARALDIELRELFAPLPERARRPRSE